mmetsp:Transcript_58424/g.153916  ORF Transcript_58424/g.153916 Transcript_58424/m.153916 type:complete len:94 (-) Transcript_58424:47-328(-)
MTRAFPSGRKRPDGQNRSETAGRTSRKNSELNMKTISRAIDFQYRLSINYYQGSRWRQVIQELWMTLGALIGDNFNKNMSSHQICFQLRNCDL